MDNTLAPKSWLFPLVMLFCSASLLLGAAGGYRYAAAKGDAALATARATWATSQAIAADDVRHQALAAAGRLVQQTLRANALEAQFDQAKTLHTQEKQALLKRINDVTTVYIPASGAAPEPLPRCVFTAGFVREYNVAIGAEHVPGAAPARTASLVGQATQSATSADAWLRESGLSQPDLLAHAGDYGQYCRDLGAQVNGLLDFEAMQATSESSDGGADGHH